MFKVQSLVCRIAAVLVVGSTLAAEQVAESDATLVPKEKTTGASGTLGRAAKTIGSSGTLGRAAKTTGSSGTLGGALVEVGLISEYSRVVAGETFTIGVSIRHREDYHTYWHSPGTVGLATMVKWDLPEGFVVGELAWPSPERCKMEGYNTHGYKRDVVLLADVTPPVGYSGEAVLKASLTWMACSVGTCCNLQYGKKQLKVHVGERAVVVEDAAKRIRETRASFATTSSAVGATFSQATEEFTMDIAFRGIVASALPDPKTLYFFAKGMAVDSIRAQRIERTDAGYRLMLPRTEFAPAKLDTLEGLLHATKGAQPWPGVKGQYLRIVAKPRPDDAVDQPVK